MLKIYIESKFREYIQKYKVESMVSMIKDNSNEFTLSDGPAKGKTKLENQSKKEEIIEEFKKKVMEK